MAAHGWLPVHLSANVCVCSQQAGAGGGGWLHGLQRKLLFHGDGVESWWGPVYLPTLGRPCHYMRSTMID